YLAVCWLFFTPLIILDKRLEFWDAMELGRRVVSKHWWHLLGFAVVCGLVLICGALVCVVGVFIAMPIVRAAIVYAYEDIFDARPAPVAATPNPTCLQPLGAIRSAITHVQISERGRARVRTSHGGPSATVDCRSPCHCADQGARR